MSISTTIHAAESVIISSRLIKQTDDHSEFEIVTLSVWDEHGEVAEIKLFPDLATDSAKKIAINMELGK